ncbi:MAG TPA: glycosyltransferase family 2 protein [Roseiflexaceae bacterium]|jgi:glycosyltransferase involved in cell wall biosynthesis|nr:glycosyltransferase family 2 protein [Roseiflexaceae bacterium]
MVQHTEHSTLTMERSAQTAEWSFQPSVSPTVALIPAYNEERFIGSLVLAVRAYVDQVVVIDDGSRDRTIAIAKLAGATVIQHQVNQGKAAAVNTGFAYVRQFKPSAVVMLDGDGQHCADDIPQVLEPVVDGSADIVVGSRFMEVKSDIPAYRQVGQHSLTLATNLASGVRISDSQSGYRAFSARALEELSFGQGGFSIESEMQFQAREHSLRVIEVPIKVIYAERAKRNPFKHGMQVVNSIVRMVGQTRPLVYFGLAGVTLFILGTLLGLYMVNIFTQTHTLAVGYGLITVMLCVMGMFLFFAGVMLHSTREMMIEMRRSLVERLSRVGQA